MLHRCLPLTLRAHHPSLPPLALLHGRPGPADGCLQTRMLAAPPMMTCSLTWSAWSAGCRCTRRAQQAAAAAAGPTAGRLHPAPPPRRSAAASRRGKAQSGYGVGVWGGGGGGGRGWTLKARRGRRGGMSAACGHEELGMSPNVQPGCRRASASARLRQGCFGAPASRPAANGSCCCVCPRRRGGVARARAGGPAPPATRSVRALRTRKLPWCSTCTAWPRWRGSWRRAGSCASCWCCWGTWRTRARCSRPWARGRPRIRCACLPACLGRAGLACSSRAVCLGCSRAVRGCVCVMVACGVAGLAGHPALAGGRAG